MAEPRTAVEPVVLAAVALGGVVGSLGRYAVAVAAPQPADGLPVATLLVNVVGSLVLGLLVGGGTTGWPLALVGIGFCGALTTFSTLALELWDAMADGRPHHAVANVALSLGLGLGAAWLGWALAAG